MSQLKESHYSIPARFRKMENMHIAFWLMKDISWCMIWRELGIAMVIPTLSIAVIIAWRTRKVKSELAHNLAIIFWISANAYWMISEFFHFDSNMLFGDYTFKHLAIIPFVIGIAMLAYYYILWRPRHRDAVETM